VRTLAGLPKIRRDLIKRRLYLVPNSIVVSRGCPHVCDFCYKEAFFEGGKSFYTQSVDAALAEIDRLPGRHLYFLDDHLFGDRRFATALFDGMRGMGRLWQAAGTVNSVLAPDLLERAVASGLRSLFVGFETLNPANLAEQRKYQNLKRDYSAAIRRLHDLGVMINGSFVFGMDADEGSVFARTVEWAIEHGIETATFHILTPYPGTALYKRMSEQARIRVSDWELYDTRHAVFEPARLTGEQLENGYQWAYREFYRWRSIARRPSRRPAALRLRRRMEEVRAAVGFHHQDETGRLDAARPRNDSQRIRTTGSGRRAREPQLPTIQRANGPSQAARNVRVETAQPAWWPDAHPVARAMLVGSLARWIVGSLDRWIVGSLDRWIVGSRPALLVQILDEHDLVPLLVVNELVDTRADGEQPESAGTDAFRFADVHVGDWIAERLADCRVGKLVDVESRAWIGNAVHEHSLGAQARDPHGS
jgi:hypothetical protein